MPRRFLFILCSNNALVGVELTEGNILDDYYAAPLYDTLMQLDLGDWRNVTSGGRDFIVVRVQ